MAKCNLCGNDSILVHSHIIPKFVFDWLKGTSATGYFRSGATPNLRQQDGPKEKLFCRECETRLSVWENKFSEIIFKPYQSNFSSSKPFEFHYEDWLIKFAVSLALRVSLTTEESKSFINPELINALNKAQNEWKQFLLGKSDVVSSEFHLFFAGPAESAPKESTPKNFNIYMLRGVDSNPFYNEQTETLGYFIKLPSIIITSFLLPNKPNGWEGTKIESEGILKTPQFLKDALFGNFLLMRARIAQERIETISDLQNKKIIDSIKQLNPFKYFASGTYEAIKWEKLRKNSQDSNDDT